MEDVFYENPKDIAIDILSNIIFLYKVRIGVAPFRVKVISPESIVYADFQDISHCILLKISNSHSTQELIQEAISAIQSEFNIKLYFNHGFISFDDSSLEAIFRVFEESKTEDQFLEKLVSERTLIEDRLSQPSINNLSLDEKDNINSFFIEFHRVIVNGKLKLRFVIGDEVRVSKKLIRKMRLSDTDYSEYSIYLPNYNIFRFLCRIGIFQFNEPSIFNGLHCHNITCFIDQSEFSSDLILDNGKFIYRDFITFNELNFEFYKNSIQNIIEEIHDWEIFTFDKFYIKISSRFEKFYVNDNLQRKIKITNKPFIFLLELIKKDSETLTNIELAKITGESVSIYDKDGDFADFAKNLKRKLKLQLIDNLDFSIEEKKYISEKITNQIKPVKTGYFLEKSY